MGGGLNYSRLGCRRGDLNPQGARHAERAQGVCVCQLPSLRPSRVFAEAGNGAAYSIRYQPLLSVVAVWAIMEMYPAASLWRSYRCSPILGDSRPETLQRLRPLRLCGSLHFISSLRRDSTGLNEGHEIAAPIGYRAECDLHVFRPAFHVSPRGERLKRNSEHSRRIGRPEQFILIHRLRSFRNKKARTSVLCADSGLSASIPSMSDNLKLLSADYSVNSP